MDSEAIDELIEKNRLRALEKLSQKRSHSDIINNTKSLPSKRQHKAESNSDCHVPHEVLKKSSNHHNSGMVCESCGRLDDGNSAKIFDLKCKESFGISICQSCKANNEDYMYLTKADVQKTYLLPDGTIRVLKYMEKENPRYKSWTPMRLYLRKEAKVWALKRWGTLEAIEDERKRRNSKKWDDSVRKTRGIFGCNQKNTTTKK